MIQYEQNAIAADGWEKVKMAVVEEGSRVYFEEGGPIYVRMGHSAVLHTLHIL